MGQIFRKCYTMPIPAGAEIVDRDGVRVARWRLRNGRTRTGEVVEGDDGVLRVRGQSRTFIARYRDGTGQMVDVRTDCREEVAARAVLAHLERRAELVRSGVITPDEGDAADHVGLPIVKHFDAYEAHLRAKGSAPRRISMLRARLDRLARECKFTRINKIAPGPIERWLVARQDEGMGAATRNNYRESIIGFCNWCRRTKRLTHNPVADLPRADQQADRKHHRRALTEEELVRLLRAAEVRPLAEYGRTTVSAPAGEKARTKASRATWKRAPLAYADLDAAVERAREALEANPALVAALERDGRQRALVYRVLAQTGLRVGELASLTVGQLELERPVPYAILDAADEKNRKGSNIPLRADLAAAIREWLAERLTFVQAECREWGEPIPVRLPASTPLFNVPTGLIRIFDRDREAAGIPKRDERNRVLDLHALRVTFGTHLCAAGVPLRVAQAAMRHSKPELTANIYTDPKLLDVAGAVAALPSLSTQPASPPAAASSR